MTIQKMYEKVITYASINRVGDPDFITMNPEDYHHLVVEARKHISSAMDYEFKTFMGIRILRSSDLGKGEVILSTDNSK